MMRDLIYSYRRKSSAIVGAFAFFGIGAAFMAVTAVNNHKSLVINGILRLSVDRATTFYWCVAIVSVCLALCAVLVAIVQLFLKPKPFIRLSEDRIALPQGFWKRTFKEIPYHTIRGLRVTDVHRQTFIRIDHASGKTWIARAMLDGDAEFSNLGRSLASRIGELRR